MIDKWIFEPYISVGPIRFGMSIEEIQKILGEPKKTIKSPMQQVREVRENLIIFYSVKNQTVEEISCSPGINVYYHNKNIIQDNILFYLKQFDNDPYEGIGTIVFFKLGVATSGYHNNDESQKNVTFFKQGVWDDVKPRLKPYLD